MFSWGRSDRDSELWEDRQILFDANPSMLELRAGEISIDVLGSVEDTKGNNGQRGTLMITNLRIIWQSHKDARTNLSVGYSCIQNLTIRTAQSRLRGSTQALYIMTKYGSSRFEFIFTSLVKASPRLFTTVQAVFRAYETSKLYRDLKLRGAVIKDKALLLLPSERVFSKLDGVWNLSSDQGNLGTLFCTNIRVVWHAALAENFNVSIPYVQLKSVRVRDSKFGPALVLDTSARSGGYMLGFRIDPDEALRAAEKEISALLATAATAPVFGIEYTVEEKPESLDALRVSRASDDVEIVSSDASSGDAFAAYFADSNKEMDRPLMFAPELGLAVETPPEGLSLDRLWSVV